MDIAMEVDEQNKPAGGDNDNLEMVDLPTLALDKIIGFLDYGSRKTCRLVCQKLKKHAESTGLSVKIDGRETASTDFCISVTVTEAQIQFLKQGHLNLDPEHLENWKIVILTAPVDTNWIVNGLLRHCTNLRILIIREECLISQDFQNPSEPMPVFEHLTEVEFSLSSKSFGAAFLKLKTVLNRRLTVKDTKNLDSRVQKNMACLLANIRSRRLKAFTGFVMANIAMSDAERKIRWEHNPLYEFLQFHRNTLEVIILPGLFSGEVPPPYPVYQLPRNIKILTHLSGCSKKILTYWKDLLLAQNSLQKMSLADISNTNFPLLQSALINNAPNLTDIDLSFSSSPEKITSLDMKIFRECGYLKCFGIHCVKKESNQMVIRNLNELPHSQLTTLSFTDVEIGPDFDGVKFLEDGFHPKVLRLVEVSTFGFFKDRLHLLKFMQLLLRCRDLDVFSIKMHYSHQESVLKTWNCSEYRVSALSEIGLKVWIANLGDKEPPNHACVVLDFSDMRDVPASQRRELKVPDPSADEPYIESERAVNLTFLDLSSRFETALLRESPFHIPRNAESYTIWINQKTKAYKIQANTQPYSKRVNDIQGRIRINMKFVLNGKDGNTTFLPLEIQQFI